MFDPSDQPRVFGIAPGEDFPRALVQGVLRRGCQQGIDGGVQLLRFDKAVLVTGLSDVGIGVQNILSAGKGRGGEGQRKRNGGRRLFHGRGIL